MLLFSELNPKQLKALVNNLSRLRGMHTELVSVYIPAGYNINEMKTLISNEQGTAVNIKSKTTRKNVMGALEKVNQRLKSYNQTPKNGLIIFCGNISEKEGVQDMKLWEIEPPEPIIMRLYRCDQAFITDPLKDMTREREVYGLISIDTQEASIVILRGKATETVKHMTSLVPGKTGKGGQSAARYSRVRQGLLLTFKKEVGEIATKAFEAEKDLLGIIIGGPGQVKEDFAEGEYLSEAMRKKIRGIKDLGYAGPDGIKELIGRSEDVLAQSGIIREKQVLGRFFEHLKKETGLSAYGFSEVKKALDAGAIDTLIVSEALPMGFFEITCKSCGHKEEKILRKDRIPDMCVKCGGKLDIKEKDLFDALEKIAETTSTKFEVVSKETQEGAQFLQLGGIGAILRYKLE